MKILDYAEVLARYPSQIGLLDWADGDLPRTPVHVRRVGELGYPNAPYVGLCAMEGPQAMSRIEVNRRNWTTRKGTETFAGLSWVITRPDAVRRGYARALLREMDRRERSAGIELAFLWTRTSWVAHGLYEKEGYRDLCSFPLVAGLVEDRPQRLSTGYTMRCARKSDAELLSRLNAGATQGREGFFPRFPGAFNLAFAMGWREPKWYRILLHRGRPVGYVNAHQERESILVDEGAVLAHGEPRDHLPALVDALAGIARGKWLCLSATTFARDAERLLHELGLSSIPRSYQVLMGKDLTGRRGLAEVERVCRSPTFWFHNADRF